MSLLLIVMKLIITSICVSHLNYKTIVEAHSDSSDTPELEAVWEKYGDIDFMHDIELLIILRSLLLFIDSIIN